MRESSLVVVLTVREGTEHEMRGVFATLAERLRNDQGILGYELYADQTDPRRFLFMERWADESDQIRHDQESAHVRDFAKNHRDKVQTFEVFQLDSIA